MSTKLDSRPDGFTDGYNPDDAPFRARTPSADELENWPVADNDDLSDDYRSSEGLSPEELRERDAAGNPVAASSNGAMRGEAAALGGTSSNFGTAALGTAIESAGTGIPVGRIARIAVNVRDHRGIAAGGAGVAVTLVVLVAGLSSSSLDLKHYTANVENKFIGAAQRVERKRMTKHVVKAMQKVRDKLKNPTQQEQAVGKLAEAKLESEGVKFTDDPHGSGAGSMEITDSSGEKVKLDMNQEDMTQEFDKLDKASPGFQDEFADKITTTQEAASDFARDPSAEGWLKANKISEDSSWAERTPDNPDATPLEQFDEAEVHSADALREAEGKPTIASSDPASDPGKSADGKTTTNNTPIEDLNKSISDANDSLAKNVQNATIADTKSAIDVATAAENTESGIGTVLSDSFESGATADISAISGQLAVDEAAAVGKSGLNPIFIFQQACKAKAALQVINNLRYSAYALELIRFGFQIASMSDASASGARSSKARSLVEIAMHTPNAKTGQTFGSGGAIANMNGDKTVHASPGLLAKYSTGYASAGILAKAEQIIAPFAFYCAVAGNIIVNFAAFAVGITAAVISGGTSALTSAIQQAAPLILIVAIQDEVTLLLTPMIVRLGAHLVMQGIKSGDIMEAMFMSGFPKGLGAMSNAHVMAPATLAVHGALSYDAEQAKKRELAKASLYDRYFNVKNDNSLMGHAAVGIATAVQTIRGGGVVNYIGSVGSSTQTKLARSLFPSTYADANTTSKCNDPQTLHNITGQVLASDDFCNNFYEVSPNLDIDHVHQELFDMGATDENGVPKSEDMLAYRDQCAIGAPGGVAYKVHVASDGSESSKTDLCLTHGDPVKGETATLAQAYGLSNLVQPHYAWWQKALGATTYAAAADAGNTGPVGIHDLYMEDLAYSSDLQTAGQRLSGNFEDTTATASVNKTNSGGAASGTGNGIAGVPIKSDNYTGDCPQSPTIVQEGINKYDQAWIKGNHYDIMMCAVHGVHLSTVVAQEFDNLFNDMATAGYSMSGSSGFRSYAEQAADYNNGKGSGSFAPPGQSNHQFGTAVDISCHNNDGSGAAYSQGTGRGRDSFIAGVSKYPCLDWVHQNSAKYGLLLMCDGQGKGGLEIRAGTGGGCEWWHLSPNGD